MSEIDWDSIGEQLGMEGHGGDARRALEILLGEEPIRASVDYFVTGGPQSGLVQSALEMIRPWTAMQRCDEICRGSASTEHRRMAIALLKGMGDRRILPWVRDYLTDPDPGVRYWSMSTVIELLFDDMIEPEEAAPFAVRGAVAQDPRMRRKAAALSRLIEARDLEPDQREPHLLARSPRFEVLRKESTTILCRVGSGEEIAELGDHEGGATCALISSNEQWFAAGGDGLYLYDADRGLEGFWTLTSGDASTAVPEQAGPTPIAAMREEPDGVLRLLVDPWWDAPGTWEVDVETRQLRRVAVGPDLRGEPWRADVEY